MKAAGGEKPTVRPDWTVDRKNWTKQRIKDPKTGRKVTVWIPDDVTWAHALGTYHECNGDIDATFEALKKKVSKTALRYLAERYRWDLRLEEHRNKLIVQAEDDVLARKREALVKIRNMQTRLHAVIMGYRTNEGKVVPGIAGKSLEGCTEALLRTIEHEAHLLGIRSGDEGRGEDGPPKGGILQLVQLTIDNSKNGGGGEKEGADADNSKQESDPLGIGEGLSRFEVRGDEADR